MIRISNIELRKLLSILLFSLFIIFLGCEKEEISEAEKLNRKIYQATVFEEFAAQSIDELIIDLRYNGGGRNDVAEYLASWIAGSHSNSVFYKLLHNN